MELPVKVMNTCCATCLFKILSAVAVADVYVKELTLTLLAEGSAVKED